MTRPNKTLGFFPSFAFKTDIAIFDTMSVFLSTINPPLQPILAVPTGIANVNLRLLDIRPTTKSPQRYFQAFDIFSQLTL